MKHLCLYREHPWYAVPLLCFLFLLQVVFPAKAAVSAKDEKKIDSLLKVIAANLEPGADSLQNKIPYGKLADLFLSSRNYTLALDYYFRQLRLSDKENKPTDTACLSYAGLYSQIGLCYFSMNNTDKALTYFNNGLSVMKSCKGEKESAEYKKRYYKLIINVGSVYLEKRDFETARTFLERGLSDKITFDNKESRSALYNNLGIIATEQQQYEKAFEYYNRALELRSGIKDTAGMAQVLNNMGKIYYLTNELSKAEKVLKRSLLLTAGTGNVRSEIFTYQALSATYEKQGNVSEALEMFKLYKERYDNLINSESVAKSTGLDMRYKYEKQISEHQIKQQLLLSRKERTAAIFIAVAGILLLLFIIAMLWIRYQRIRMSQVQLAKKGLELESRNLTLEKDNLALEKDNLKLEKDNLELMNEKLHVELDYKKKELTTQVMYLLQKNELIAKTIKEIQEIRQAGADEMALRSILRSLKSNLDTGTWDEFEMRFQQVHQDFYNKLHALYPDLTPGEVKLSAFLRLNMTTKDISAITFHTPKSIQVARTRLRKKLNMERDDNLISYLQQL